MRRTLLTFATLCLAASGAAAQKTPARPPAAPETRSAYFEGREVEFHLARPGKGQKPLTIGPWRFGVRVSNPQPRDKRLNLYLVSPGSEHTVPGRDDFDHNDVINALPRDEGAEIEWDVYWAVVLDPALRTDFRSERDLLLAMQQSFTPGDLMEFEDVPGHGFLRAFLKIDEIRELKKFRRKNGQLPRLVIVPAGFAVKASVREATEIAGALEPAD